jgi:hypothetical protein
MNVGVGIGQMPFSDFFFDKRNWEKFGNNCFSSVNWTNFANFVGKFTNFLISQDWKKIKILMPIAIVSVNVIT